MAKSYKNRRVFSDSRTLSRRIVKVHVSECRGSEARTLKGPGNEQDIPIQIEIPPFKFLNFMQKN